MSLQTLARTAALAVLVVIIFATLAPLHQRPTIGVGNLANLERFAAYFVLGICLRLGFPSRAIAAGIFITGMAIVLELLQFAAVDRHGEISDLLVKLAGGLVGLLLCHTVLRYLDHAENNSRRRHLN